MKYMTLIYEYDGEIEKYAEDEYKALIQQHKELQKQAKEVQIYLGANELKPAPNAVSVRSRNGELAVTDGPFIESKEIFVGYYIFDCTDLDAALHWARMIPTGANGGVEVRPLDGGSCGMSGPDNDSNPINADISLYSLLVYQPESVVDAYSAKELEELVDGNRTMAEKAIASNHYLGGNKLMPAVTATSIRTNNGQQSITDGPFSEAKEVLLGLHVLACSSIEEAVNYAEQIPNVHAGVVEIRPVNFYEQGGIKPIQWTS